jgi:hypothetical protein
MGMRTTSRRRGWSDSYGRGPRRTGTSRRGWSRDLPRPWRSLDPLLGVREAGFDVVHRQPRVISEELMVCSVAASRLPEHQLHPHQRLLRGRHLDLWDWRLLPAAAGWWRDPLRRPPLAGDHLRLHQPQAVHHDLWHRGVLRHVHPRGPFPLQLRPQPHHLRRPGLKAVAPSRRHAADPLRRRGSPYLSRVGSTRHALPRLTANMCQGCRGEVWSGAPRSCKFTAFRMTPKP